MVRYYSYIEITRRAHQTLWREYEHLQATFDNFAMQHIRDQEDIYPVFRELFHKQSSKSEAIKYPASESVTCWLFSSRHKARWHIHTSCKTETTGPGQRRQTS